MRHIALIGLICIAVFLLTGAAALSADQPAGQAYTGTPPAHWHEIDTDWMKKFHHPMEGLEMGLDIRLREVYTNNLFGLDKQFGDSAAVGKPGNWNEHHWQRYRTRWSTKWTLSPDVDFNTRLTWEFWSMSSPPRCFTDSLAAQDTDLREAIFDNLNIVWRNAFEMPMTLTIGRQDIMLGTGWLVLDGTPGDGSRTAFFDAVRATIDLREKTKLDLIYLKQYDDEDKWLQPFNHREYLHLTQKTDEDGFIFYLTDKSIENTTLEGYYIYKKEEPSSWAKSSKSWWATSPGKDAEIHTIGGRIAQKLDTNWSYSAELAKQFGKRDEQSMTGLGANTKLAYAFNDEWSNELRVGYEYLSGNDPDTSADEKFDTLWGDWPQFQRGGDLQSYIWTAEGALGEVANLHRLGFGHTFKPSTVWTIATDYNLMWADENTFGSTGASGFTNAYGSPRFSSGGNFRGQMLSWIATYRCCKNFNTHFMVDYFVPGSYYDGSTQDAAIFARVNVEWAF